MSEGGDSFPSELAEAAFLLQTGWTPQDLEGAPEETIQKMVVLMNAQGMAQMQQAAEMQAKARR